MSERCSVAASVIFLHAQAMLFCIKRESAVGADFSGLECGQGFAQAGMNLED